MNCVFGGLWPWGPEVWACLDMWIQSLVITVKIKHIWRVKNLKPVDPCPVSAPYVGVCHSQAKHGLIFTLCFILKVTSSFQWFPDTTSFPVLPSLGWIDASQPCRLAACLVHQVKSDTQQSYFCWTRHAAEPQWDQSSVSWHVDLNGNLTDLEPWRIADG